MPTKTAEPTPATQPAAPQLLEYHFGNLPVRAFSTQRQGGVSRGAYGELNINPFCGDNPQHVSENKQRLCHHLGLKSPDALLLPHQVHGCEIYAVSPTYFSQSSEKQNAALNGIDALMTDVKGICVGVSTADCVPILLYDPQHAAVCAVHAGWRGTVKHIASTAVAAMTAHYGTSPTELLAVIGPAISQAAFEVGDEVYEAFREAQFHMPNIARRQKVRPQGAMSDAQSFSSVVQGATSDAQSISSDAYITQTDAHSAPFDAHSAPFDAHSAPFDAQVTKWHIDLFAANTQLLLDAGLELRHIQVSNICTYANADRFFSARRLGINSGRIYTGILLRQ